MCRSACGVGNCAKIPVEKGAPVAVLGPQHRKEGLVHLRASGALVAAVDISDVGRVVACFGRYAVRHQRPSRRVGAVGARAVEGPSVVKDSPLPPGLRPAPLQGRRPPVRRPHASRAHSRRERETAMPAGPGPSGANPQHTRWCRRPRWSRRAQSSRCITRAAPPTADSCRPGERRAGERPGGFHNTLSWLIRAPGQPLSRAHQRPTRG